MNAAARPIEPLPAAIVDEISSRHRRWSDQVDVHAEPWTMEGPLAVGRP